MTTIPIHVLQSKSHVITVTVKGVRYKLFQIHFGSSGDIYVNFPYYKNSNGLVGHGILSPNQTSITLTPDNAKTTSHLVKFAYHPDGEAHFSQDGKVRTEIRRKSAPLTEVNGHLFTISMQGIENFEKAETPKYDNKFSEKKSILNFNLTEIEFEGLKFIGTWQSFDNAVIGINLPEGSKHGGPQFAYKDAEGKISFGFLMGPEPGNPFTGYVLSLRVTPIGILDKDNSTALLFVGGFDKNARDLLPDEDYSFLVFIYPHVAKVGQDAVIFDNIDFLSE